MVDDVIIATTSEISDDTRDEDDLDNEVYT